MTATTYPGPIRAIHWMSALCILMLIPAGLIMARMPDGPAQERLFFLHESFGVLVLALTLARLIWKIGGKKPEPAALARHERIAAHGVHGLLYILLIATPILGWLGVSAFGASVDVFGLFSLPPLMGKDENAAGKIFTLHLIAASLIGLLVCAHIAGVIRHTIRGDGVIERMLPSFRRK